MYLIDCVFAVVQMCNGSTENPYTNPKAPVHFITGAPGNREGHDISWIFPYLLGLLLETPTIVTHT
jgi:hypothetical protein